jgi:argininosuccinate lyase
MPDSGPARFTDARLKAEPADTFVQTVNQPFVESEMSRFSEFCQVDKAHTVMLAEQGIIGKDDAGNILAGLLKWEELGSENAPIDPSRSSYLFQIEAFLAQEIGEDMAGRMHTARGRADYGSTSLSLYVRNRLLLVMEHIVRFQRVLLTLADRHLETLMPGYTHLQQSQPQTFGHYILSHYYPLERDFWRLEGAFRRININPLGCLARAGTSWPIDRRRTAELLGFDGIVMNAQDQTCYRREHTAEVAAALSLVLSNLGRLVTDLDQWFAEEFGFIDFSDAYAGSSSIMPHKKNPYPFERCRALAGEAIGWFPSILGVIKLPHTSAADPTFSPSYDGIAQFGVDYCCDMLRLIGEVLETVTVDEQRMRDGFTRSWTTSSNLADVIVRERGLPFRSTHAVVGRLVRNCIEQDILPADVKASHLDQASEEILGRELGLTDEQVQDAIDPWRFIETRVTEGSANPQRVKEALEDAHERLENESAWLQDTENKLQAAQEKLQQAVGKISQ